MFFALFTRKPVQTETPSLCTTEQCGWSGGHGGESTDPPSLRITSLGVDLQLFLVFQSMMYGTIPLHVENLSSRDVDDIADDVFTHTCVHPSIPHVEREEARRKGVHLKKL